MLLTLTVSTFFLIVPDEGPDRFKDYKCPHCEHIISVDTWELPTDIQAYNYFLFDYRPLFIDTWVWLMGVHLTCMGMAWVIWRQEKEYPRAGLIYFLIWTIDVVFFIMFYADPFKGIKLTWNIVKVVIFGYAIERETRHRHPGGQIGTG